MLKPIKIERKKKNKREMVRIYGERRENFFEQKLKGCQRKRKEHMMNTRKIFQLQGREIETATLCT